MAGRPTRLTAEVAQKIIAVLRQGGTVSMACAMAHVNRDTYYAWLRQAKTQRAGKHKKFLMAVKEAQAFANQAAVRTVQLAIIGGWFQAPVYDQDGNPIPIIDPKTGQQKRDDNRRLMFEMRHQYKEPEAKLALRRLQARDPEFGGGPRGAAVRKTDNIEVDPAQQGQCRIEISTLQAAVQILADLGVKIPKPELPGPIVGGETVEEASSEKNQVAAAAEDSPDDGAVDGGAKNKGKAP